MILIYSYLRFFPNKKIWLINKKFEVKDPTKIDVSYTFTWMCIDKKTGNYGYIVNISDYTLKRKDMSEIIKQHQLLNNQYVLKYHYQ